MSATLFNINDKYKSHPDYPLQRHLNNIAASFNDKTHKEAAFFHDIGKLSEEFQEYVCNPLSKTKTTHALESALIYIVEKNYQITPEIFALFITVLKHHGDLENTNDFLYSKFSFSEDLLERYSNLAKRLHTICNRTEIKAEINIEEFCDVFDTETFVQDKSLDSIDVYFLIKDTFSKLIFADKYEAIFKERFHETKEANWKLYIDKLITLVKSKNNSMSHVRNQAREEIISNYKKNRDKKIFIIEAPTGIGKTFSALHLALEIALDKKKKRIINCLPMTSIIDQVFEEYQNIISEDEILKFHHLTHSKNYTAKIAEDIEAQSEQQQHSQQNDFLAMSWSTDKIIVTTFNQLFNIFYSNKNRDLVKFWTIRNSVIILDEIQAIPRILLQDVSKTLEFLTKKFNIDFILMSATIPAIKGFIDKNIFTELLDNKYFSMEFNNRYTLCMKTEIDSAELLLAEIKKKYCALNSILCVVNTKKLSLQIYNDLQDSIKPDELFLLNTNFIPKQRKEILQTIKNRLRNNQKTVLISTQVVEAGVDLDFDYGIREFAPLYCIIQTAGRINREGIKQNAELLITGEISRNSPYHTTDLLKEKVTELLFSRTQESYLLPKLKQYFDIAISRTSPDTKLRDDIKNLEFQKVYKTFTDYFMKSIPNITPVFIETEDGLYDHFFNEVDLIYRTIKQPDISLEEKMNFKSRLKKINKEISQYIINVSENETTALQNFHENMEIKVCSFGSVKNEEKYSMKKGWLGEKTLEIFF